jgi:hypothetical protein
VVPNRQIASYLAIHAAKSWKVFSPAVAWPSSMAVTFRSGGMTESSSILSTWSSKSDRYCAPSAVPHETP